MIWCICSRCKYVIWLCSTHVKTHILSTSCWLNKLVASCWTSCNKLVKPTTCYKLLTTTCWQVVGLQICSKMLEQLVPSMMTTNCNKVVETTCWQVVMVIGLVASCFQQLVDKLFTCRPVASCWNSLYQAWRQQILTRLLKQPVDKLIWSSGCYGFLYNCFINNDIWTIINVISQINIIWLLQSWISHCVCKQLNM